MNNATAIPEENNVGPGAVTPEALPAITHAGMPVVTTALLARLYGTDGNNLIKNYQRNAARFVEGKHYHRLEGETLRAFKDCMTKGHAVNIPRQVRNLLLWTERGAARHAKMLETEQAWEVFERLEDCYFGKAAGQAVLAAPDEQQVYRHSFQGNPVLFVRIKGRTWVAAGNICTALGLGSSDRVTRSLPEHRKLRWSKGVSQIWLIDGEAAMRAADYCRGVAAGEWRGWLPGVLRELETAPVAVSGDLVQVEAGMSAVAHFGVRQLLETRLLCSYDPEGRLVVRALDKDAVILRLEQLAGFIGDPEAVPRRYLSGILAAVAGRMTLEG